jgi:magnesium transporter
MLYANDGVAERQVLEPGRHVASDAVWFDLVNPTDSERALAERLTGLRVPSHEEIAEIESSSRVFTENSAAYLSMPYSLLDPNGGSMATSAGFVLSDKHLLTLRFEKLPAFETYAEAFGHGGLKESTATFVGLAEAIVDRMADVLEHVAAELTQLSKATFRSDAKGRQKSMRRADRELRAILTSVGDCGNSLGNLQRARH